MVQTSRKCVTINLCSATDDHNMPSSSHLL
jgi:hypothetical protein